MSTVDTAFPSPCTCAGSTKLHWDIYYPHQQPCLACKNYKAMKWNLGSNRRVQLECGEEYIEESSFARYSILTAMGKLLRLFIFLSRKCPAYMLFLLHFNSHLSSRSLSFIRSWPGSSRGTVLITLPTHGMGDIPHPLLQTHNQLRNPRLGVEPNSCRATVGGEWEKL